MAMLRGASQRSTNFKTARARGRRSIEWVSRPSVGGDFLFPMQLANVDEEIPHPLCFFVPGGLRSVSISGGLRYNARPGSLTLWMHLQRPQRTCGTACRFRRCE